MEPELFENLPPEWLAFIAEWAPYVLGALVLTTAAAHLLLPLARKLETWAVVTAATWDDGLTRWLVVGLEWVVTTSRTLMEWLPILARAGAAREPAPKPERVSRPPSNGALALGLVVLAAALSATTLGCGAGALGTQADLVALGGISAARADEALTRARARELDRIVESAEAECGQDGCSEDRAAHYRAELALAEERWAPALECRAPVVEALRAWGDGIETAHRAATDEIGTELLIHLGLRFVSSYSALRSCVNAAATDVDIPALPAPLSGLAGAR